jgi:hypothetical protein
MIAAAKPTVSAEQRKAIDSLLGEKTLEAVANEAGVPLERLQRWLDDDDTFQAAYQAAVRESTNLAISRIKAGTSMAVQALMLALKEGTCAQKIRAAKVLISCSNSLAERECLEEKLDGIVELTARNQQTNSPSNGAA